jgi:phosphate/sulfate permease
MDNTIKRLGLWALGALLPRQQVFDRHVRHMARGVTYLVCGGMIVAAVFLALLAGTYVMLVEQGLSVAVSVAITTVLALLGAAICFLLADRSLSRASQLTEELKLTPPPLPKVKADVNLQEGASVLVNAFLDGFRHPHRYRPHSRDQADLFGYDEDETIGELHLQNEREYDDKDIIRFRPRHQRHHEAG